jgi:hypothetical protein
VTVRQLGRVQSTRKMTVLTTVILVLRLRRVLSMGSSSALGGMKKLAVVFSRKMI